ncbi:MAG TPA: hypothetical protein VFS16_19515 [Acidimicrobiia bacterium]|nr:hypothetical protein [Acidimicrobiia bacterium]
MAIAVELDFDGATLEQYDQVTAKMGLQPGGQGPPGSLSHWVTRTPNGIRVTDVWQSKELFEQFAQEKIGPISASVGLAEPSQITFHEVHNYFGPG